MMSPQEELQALNAQVDQATDLEELRPIFERMTAISHEHPDDFEVVLAVDQVRRHIIEQGKLLRERQEAPELEEYEAETGTGTGESYQPLPGTGPHPDEPPPSPGVPPADAFDAFTGASQAPPIGAVEPPTQIFDMKTAQEAASKPLSATGSFAPPGLSASMVSRTPVPGPRTPVPPSPPAPSSGWTPPPAPPSTPQASGGGRKLALIGGAALLVLIAAGGLFWFLKMRGGEPKPAGIGAVAIEVATNPPGANIQVNGEAKCTSNCRVELPPGSYQLTAVLDGFEPGAAPLNVIAGNPMTVNLTLVPQSGSLRLVTDLDAATVMLDGKPVGNVQDGQFTVDRVASGEHVVKLVGKGREVEFPFEMTGGQLPTITGPVKAAGLFATVVASMGQQAKVYGTSAAKVAVNGQAQGQTSAQGLELKDIPAGEQTLSVGEGAAERRLVVSFGSAPAITAFFKKPDVTTGTLVVSTNEDDVTVALNGREYRRKTSRGTLRIPIVGAVVVHVSKPGFQPEPDQRVNIKKGEETKVAFQLKPLPRVAALQVRNGVPGTQILMDDQPLGRIGPDGTLSAANLAPGEHSFEARREGFQPKKIQRALKAGETLGISGAELALAPAGGTVHLAVSPAEAAVSYRRSDETQLRPVRESTLRLAPGSYVFVARAPNYAERTVLATVAAGETHNVEITLLKAEAPKPRPTITWAGWAKEGNDFVRRGGNRVVVCSGPMVGALSFTAQLVKGGGIFRSARLRWFIDDGSGNTQYEVDKRRFQAKGPAGSRSKDLPKGTTPEDERTYAVEIDIFPDRVVHKIRAGGEWVMMDSHPAKVGADTRFGFVIPGNDEIAISDLRFTPR